MIPSGEQHEIAYADQRATLTQVGAALRSYTSGGRDVVAPFPVKELAPHGSGQPLIPWPGRIRDGRYTVGERTYQLALSDPTRSNAIHGLVRWLPWSVERIDATALRMSVTIHPHPGYPWRLDVSTSYELADDGLTVVTQAVNLSDSACPYAAGFHPYFPLAADDGITVPAGLWCPGDERGLPLGEPRSVEGSAYDLRQGEPLGDRSLDTAYSELTRDDDGRARCRIGPTTLWMDETCRWVVVYSGIAGSLAVEPMTAPPDAFNSGTDLVMIQPGAIHTTMWGITP